MCDEMAYALCGDHSVTYHCKLVVARRRGQLFGEAAKHSVDVLDVLGAVGQPPFSEPCRYRFVTLVVALGCCDERIVNFLPFGWTVAPPVVFSIEDRRWLVFFGVEV